MLVVVSAEHHIHTRLIEDRNKDIMRPDLAVPAVLKIHSRDMHYSHLYGSLNKNRILDSSLKPLKLNLTVCIIICCSTILYTCIRLVLSCTHEKERNRSMTEHVIRLTGRSREEFLEAMSVATASLMISSCIYSRYISHKGRKHIHHMLEHRVCNNDIRHHVAVEDQKVKALRIDIASKRLILIIFTMNIIQHDELT